jgi:hypothetical protein
VTMRGASRGLKKSMKGSAEIENDAHPRPVRRERALDPHLRPDEGRLCGTSQGGHGPI